MKQFCRHVRENTGANDLLFGFITDTHFEENSDLRGYGANSLAHMRNFAAAGRECGAAFLINAGDMSNGNRPRKQTKREITLSAEAMRSGGLPVWFALGNHDDNTYYCKAEPADASNGFSGAEWQGLVYPDGFPAGTVAAPGVSNCFYVDFPAQKIRLLMLNTVDLPFSPRPDGTLKYYTINDHVFSKAQLEFVAHTALDFSELPGWGLLAVSHMSLGFLPNGEIMVKLLNAFRTGRSYRSSAADVKECPFRFDRHPCFPSPADPADLVHTVEADFTRQGPRDFIAHLYGHEHFDEVRTGRGFTEISFLSSLCYQNETFAPKREFGTESEDAWSMVSIDRAARRIKVFRRGAGEDFSAAY